MSATAAGAARPQSDGGTVRTDIPFRLDRLPWSRWHWLVVVSLGITWILDGLEVTILGSIGSVLKDDATLGLSDAQVGLSGTLYLLGAVTGALFFGYLTDRLGRKKLFLVTLAVYLVFTTLSGFAFDFWSSGSSASSPAPASAASTPRSTPRSTS